MRLVLGLVVGSFGLAPAAFALDDVDEDLSEVQVEAETGKKIRYRKRTELDFETLNLEATIQKPSGVLHNEPPRPIFNPLIRLRDEWNDEMRSSLDAVK